MTKSINFRTTIKNLRTQAGLSQQDVADAIGIARATYASLEAGRREPSLKELRDLSRYHEVSIGELIYEIDLLNAMSDQPIAVKEPAVAYSRSPETIDIEPRDIDPKVDPDKLRETLLYVLNKVGGKPNVGETVLYKLLYFIDMDYYEKYGKSITGLTYIHNTYGPSPVRDFSAVVTDMQAHDELDIVETKFFNNKQKKYLPQTTPNLEKLTAREIKHIDEELARLSDKTASELSDLSHKDTPWIVAKQGKPIDYRDVFYRTPMTAVTEPDDEL